MVDRDNPVAPFVLLGLLLLVIVFVLTIGGRLMDGLIERPACDESRPAIDAQCRQNP